MALVPFPTQSAQRRPDEEPDWDDDDKLQADEAGKMNKAIKDVGGSVLLISQFTLPAEWKKGRRPSFIRAAEPSGRAPAATPPAHTTAPVSTPAPATAPTRPPAQVGCAAN